MAERTFNLLGFPVVYRVRESVSPRTDEKEKLLADDVARRYGVISSTVYDGVEWKGSTFHPERTEFAGTIIQACDDGTFDLDLLIPGSRSAIQSTRKFVRGVERGDGPGQFALADTSRLPGFPARYRVPASDVRPVTRDGVESLGSSLHPRMVEFAAIGGHWNRDGTADLELIIPQDPRTPGHFQQNRKWVCGAERGEGPGTFSLI